MQGGYREGEGTGKRGRGLGIGHRKGLGEGAGEGEGEEGREGGRGKRREEGGTRREWGTREGEGCQRAERGRMGRCACGGGVSGRGIPKPGFEGEISSQADRAGWVVGAPGVWGSLGSSLADALRTHCGHILSLTRRKY